MNRTTSDEYGDKVYEVNLPPCSLKGRMPEIDHARNRYGTKRHSGTSYDPPSQQGHPAHRESCKFLVLRGGQDEGEMVLSLTYTSATFSRVVK